MIPEDNTHIQNDHSYSLHIGDKEYHWSEKYISGLQLKDLAKIEQDQDLFLIKPEIGDAVLVNNTDKFDLTQQEIERFTIKQKYKLILDGKHFDWENQMITGNQLRALGNISDNFDVYYQLKDSSEMQLIRNEDTVDLKNPGIEHFYSVAVNLTAIKINGIEYATPVGTYTVLRIKQMGNINPAYELEQLIEGKLTPLDDNGSVQIQGGEQFFGHVKDGSSADHTDFSASEINELKEIAPSLSFAEEGGYRYLLIDNLQLPEGCNPISAQALLCPDPKDGYQSRLYFESKISGKTDLNWNGTVRILDKTWHSFSWQTKPGLRLAEKLMIHLKALRS